MRTPQRVTPSAFFTPTKVTAVAMQADECACVASMFTWERYPVQPSAWGPTRTFVFHPGMAVASSFHLGWPVSRSG
jgi:hypothetical protein